MSGVPKRMAVLQGFICVVGLGVFVVFSVHGRVSPSEVVRSFFVGAVLAVVTGTISGGALTLACLCCLCWEVWGHCA